MYKMTTSWGWLLGIAIGGAFISSTSSALAQIIPDATLPNNSRVTTFGNTSLIEGGTQAGRNLFHSFGEFSVPTGSVAYFNNTLNIQNIISRVTGGSVSKIDGLISANGTANLFLINPSGIIFGENASLNIGGSFLATTANALQFGNIGIFSASTPAAPSSLLTINPSALLFNQIAAASIHNNSQAPAGLAPSGLSSSGLRVPDGKSLLLVGGDIQMDGGRLSAYGGRVELGGLSSPGTVGLQIDGNNLSLGFPDNVTRANVSLTSGANVNVAAAGGGSIAVNARNLEILNGSTLTAGIGQGLGSVGSQAGDVKIDATGAVTVTGSNIYNTVQSRAVGKSGNINITTGSLSFTKGAALQSGTFGQGDGGNVTIKADTVSFDGVDSTGFPGGAFSNVGNETEHNAVGNGGNVYVTARSLSLTNGAALSANTFAMGNAGSVIINADSISIEGVASNGNASGAFSNVTKGAIGKGGNVSITTGSLFLTNGAVLQASNAGQGNAGNILVQAQDTISLAHSFIFNNIGSPERQPAKGNVGNINLEARAVSLTDGAQLQAGFYSGGQGKAGIVSVKARDTVSFAGAYSGIFTNTEFGAVGNGSNILISAGSVSFSNGAVLQASNAGQGNGGDININADSLTVQNGSLLGSTISGQGNGGNIIINARDRINFDGNSAALTNVQTGAVGNAGDIRVTTGSLSLTNGAFLNSSILGNGNAGNIIIDARDTVNLDGRASTSFSGLTSSLLTGGVGKGGDIQITTGSLSVTNGAQVTTGTDGRGNAGNITINARDTITFDGAENGSGISSQATSTLGSNGVGNGGDIRVNARALFLKNGSELNADSFGRGNAGNIIINASDTVAFDGVSRSGLLSGATTLLSKGPGKGGDIRVTTGSLSLTNGAQLFTSVFGQGEAGNITIDARDTVNLDGRASTLFSGLTSSLLTGGVGKGGDIQITTGSLSVTNGAQLTTETDGRGNAGNITINARDTITFDGAENGSGFSSLANSTVESNGVGNGGDIHVTTGSLSVTKGSQLISSTFGRGNAGDVSINVSKGVTLAGVNNGFSSGVLSTVESGGVGKGGNIDIKAGSLSISDGAQLQTLVRQASGNQPAGRGDAGKINVDVGGAAKLDSSSIISGIDLGVTGNGGDINITAGSLDLTYGARLISSTFGRGNAGNVSINVSKGVTLAGVNNGFSSGVLSTVESGGVGKGGNIDIKAGSLSISDGAQLQTLVHQASGNQPAGRGDAGKINVDVGGAAKLDSSSITSGIDLGVTGNAGDINFTADSLDLTNGAQLISSTFGKGNAGNVSINVGNNLVLVGVNNSQIRTTVDSGGIGTAGDINIQARSVLVTDGFQIQSALFRPSGNLPAAQGRGGNIHITAADSIVLSGVGSTGFSSGLFTGIDRGASGSAGNITVNTGQFKVSDGAVVSAGTSGFGDGGNIAINANTVEALNGGQVATSTAGTGRAGTIRLNVKDSITLAGSDPNYAQRLALIQEELKSSGSTEPISDVVGFQGPTSGIFANTAPSSTGQGGSIFIDPRQVSVRDGAQISVNSQGTGNAGNINISVSNVLQLDKGGVSTNAISARGGDISINAQDIQLRHNSNIKTNSGTSDGGNIFLTANTIVALEDSDILAFAPLGRGGNITFNTSAFLSDPLYRPTASTTDLATLNALEGNGRVDVNASGAVSGVITGVPDITFLQNSLTELQQKPIDTNALIANSCIARSNKQQGTFNITGSGGLPNRPGNASVSSYPTGTVRNVQSNDTSRPWQKGDPIVEPQGVYQLPNGHLVLSRECSS